MKLLLGIFYIMIPVVVWGMSFGSTEVLLGSMGPMMIAALRFAVGTVALLGLIFLKKEKLAKVHWNHIPSFLLGGGIGISLYFYFENLGILELGATDSSLMIATLPAFTMIADIVIHKKRPSLLNTLAVITTVVGVGLIVADGGDAVFGSKPLKGYIFMLLAVIAWVIYMMITKRLLGKYSDLNMTFYLFLYSLPFFLPFLPFEKTDWSAFGYEQVSHLLFLAIGSSVLGFYYYNKALDYISALSSTIFLNFSPIVTIIYVYFNSGVVPTNFQIIGCGVIIVAATLSVLSTAQLRKKVHKVDEPIKKEE